MKFNDLTTVAKAIAGASAGAIGSMTTAFIVIPPEVAMPFYGYIIVGVLNAIIAGGLVYLSPRNADLA